MHKKTINKNRYLYKSMFFPFQVSATFAQPPCNKMKNSSDPVSSEHFISLATSYLQKEYK